MSNRGRFGRAVSRLVRGCATTLAVSQSARARSALESSYSLRRFVVLLPEAQIDFPVESCRIETVKSSLLNCSLREVVGHQSRGSLLSRPKPLKLLPRRVGPPADRRRVHGPHAPVSFGPTLIVDPESHPQLFNCILRKRTSKTPSLGLRPEDSTMSELKPQSETPRWVSDLSSPPAYKSKASGIPDPPGFPSQASSSKVRADASCGHRSHG